MNVQSDNICTWKLFCKISILPREGLDFLNLSKRLSYISWLPVVAAANTAMRSHGLLNDKCDNKQKDGRKS